MSKRRIACIPAHTLWALSNMTCDKGYGRYGLFANLPSAQRRVRKLEQMAHISTSTLAFLRELRSHNDRTWFQNNKARYEASHAEMVAFAEALMARMSEYDNIVQMSGKKSLMRIYRDVRFSKDKSPYKTYWGGGMKRDTVWLRGGYYYHIEPGNSYMGAGFWGPNTRDLKLIRDHIAQDDSRLRAIVNSADFTVHFGTLKGEQVKTAPKGFSKDHPAIDLLRYKQFLVGHAFTDKQVTASDFVDQLVAAYRAVRPFFDYMSEILTHDLNGEAIYE